MFVHLKKIDSGIPVTTQSREVGSLCDFSI